MKLDHVLAAARSLLNDIDSMQGPCGCSIDPCPHFAGFSAGDYDALEGSYSVEWPNLAVSAAKLQAALLVPTTSPLARPVREEITFRGQAWRIAETGGGCTAYRRDSGGGMYQLLTVVDDARPPYPAETAELGTYGPDDSEPLHPTERIERWSPDCDGCGEEEDDLIPHLAYRARFDGGDAQVLFYCEGCASAARGELEGAPWCGQPADEITLLDDANVNDGDFIEWLAARHPTEWHRLRADFLR